MTPIPENSCSTGNHEDKSHFGDLLTRTKRRETDSVTKYRGYSFFTNSRFRETLKSERLKQYVLITK